MKKFFILTNNLNEVTRIVKSHDKKQPWKEISETIIPQPDPTKTNYTAVLCWNGENLYYRYDEILVKDDIEIPSEEIYNNENIYSNSENRRLAYEKEADIYAKAYVGYILEGDNVKAKEAKANYLLKKQEIRNRFPDQTN